MKIGEALAQKKKMQVRLAKCNELLEKSYYYKTKPDFDYKKLRSEITDLTTKISDLKMRIIKTNLNTTVNLKVHRADKEPDISLSELIIQLGDIRADIVVLSKLYNPSDSLYSLRYDDKEDKKPQVPPEEIETQISNLNTQKTELDALLQHTNWTTELE